MLTRYARLPRVLNPFAAVIYKRNASAQALMRDESNVYLPPPPPSIDLSAAQRAITFPLPLPAKVSTAYSQYNLYPSSQASDQRTVLEACIAGGHINRAKVLWERIKTFHARQIALQSSKESESFHSVELSDGQATLSDLIPMSVHASFLRAFFRKAMVNRPLTSMSEMVEDAWRWWDMLVHDFDRVGQPTDQAFAVMIKGALVTSRLEDGIDQDQQLISLFTQMPKFGIRLSSILDDPIFDSQASASLGSLPAEEAFRNLHELAERSGSSIVLEAVSQAEREMQDALTSFEFSEEARGSRKLDPLEGVSELRPTFRYREAGEVVPIRLDSLRGHLYSLTSKRRYEQSDPLIRQTLLEESAYDAAKHQYEKEREQMNDVKKRSMNMGPKTIQNLIWEWTQLLADKIRTEIEDAKDNTKRETEKGKHQEVNLDKQFISSNEIRLLSLLDADKMAFLTIVTLCNTISKGAIPEGATVAHVCVRIGSQIEREYQADTVAKFDSKAYRYAMARAKKNPSHRGGQDSTLRRLYRIEMKKQSQTARIEGSSGALPEWSQALKVKLGARTLAYLIDVARVVRTVVVKKEDFASGQTIEETVSEEQPAFYHTYQYVRGTKLGVVKANQAILQKLETDSTAIILSPRSLPMVIPPRAWQSHSVGCYVIHQADLMRIKASPEQKRYIKAASDAGALTNVFAALDYLGSTPWVINRKVYDIVGEVWNSGEAIADIPQADPLVSIKDPARPPEVDTDLKARSLYKIQLREAALKRGNDHSVRCSINYQLEIARAYLGETMYFPHNIDFRGRVYPIPPNLSHIGDDLARGLLQFGEAKPLGVEGLKWLRVHLANLYGFDKYSIEQRALFADTHREDIFDSADQPLKGHRWWLKAEDPWQCLATCIDLAAAWRSPNPEQYLSRQPVHQDGTCNGLQHYAAIGGDAQGAEAVNLVAGDEPADVYGKVAKLVSASIDKEAIDGIEEAVLLQGHITRKVVKQTVMTTVYGVTFIGARSMVAKQLEANQALPKKRVYALSAYVTKKIFESIGDLFGGATAIQRWFSQCAKLVCRAHPPQRFAGSGKPDRMTPMIWTTPLGIPVVQPYREPKRKQITTALQSVHLEDPTMVAEVDTRGQAAAFPPNYIHSLDATHMMLTAIECKRVGIAFASVHDSFWTHAADINKMNAALRKTFIELHSQPLLESLRNEVLARYEGYRIPWSDIPKPMQVALGLRGLRRAALSTKMRSKLEAESDENPFSSFEDFSLSQEEIAELRPKMQKTDIDDTNSSVLLSDILPHIPKRGDFDVSNVTESMYFFS